MQPPPTGPDPEHPGGSPLVSGLPTSDTSPSSPASRGPSRWSGPALWTVLTAWTALWGFGQASPSGISWHFFADGSAALFGGTGLHTYAVDPQLQTGPLALAAAGLLDAVTGGHGLAAAQVLLTAGLLVALAVLGPVVPGPHRHTRLLLAGLVLAPAWTVLTVRWAHLDDALALVLLAVLVRLVVDGRHPVWAGVALAAAAAAKPWAVIAVALLLLLPGRRARGVALAAAGVLTGVVWLPFLLADPATLTAFHPPVGVSDSSLMWALGYRGGVIPAWVRPAQLVAAPLMALVVLVRGRWPYALLAGIAVRLALDPQDIAYYAAGAVLAAVLADLFGSRRRVPWLALLTAAVLWQPFVPDYATRMQTASGLGLWWYQHPTAVAIGHAGWALVVVVTALTAARADRAPGRSPGRDLWDMSPVRSRPYGDSVRGGGAPRS